MEKINYIQNPKKHNKLLWDYLALVNPETNKHSKKMHENFEPDQDYEAIRWVQQKIINSAAEGHAIKFIHSIKKGETRIIIQDWHDIKDPKGFVTVVDLIDAGDKTAFYNACVSYIIRTK